MLRLISIHALREEGDFSGSVIYWSCINFYPRPPRGGRRRGHTHTEGADRFLSTPSARRATRGNPHPQSTDCNFYPRPPRGGRRPGIWSVLMEDENFYPRPPRGGRRQEPARHIGFCGISIHALREEGDDGIRAKLLPDVKFLSTPSARRATCKKSVSCIHPRYFYPRPPRGGRLEDHPEDTVHKRFLSTPSARRATYSGWSTTDYIDLFLSTPSARRATKKVFTDICTLEISIHALREEGDLKEGYI